MAAARFRAGDDRQLISETGRRRRTGSYQVWSSRGIAAPANLLKSIQDALTAALEKTLNSSEHQQQARQSSLEPRVIKGDAYRSFLKDNEVSTKTLMGW